MLIVSCTQCHVISIIIMQNLVRAVYSDISTSNKFKLDEK